MFLSTAEFTYFNQQQPQSMADQMPKSFNGYGTPIATSFGTPRKSAFTPIGTPLMSGIPSRGNVGPTKEAYAQDLAIRFAPTVQQHMAQIEGMSFSMRPMFTAMYGINKVRKATINGCQFINGSHRSKKFASG